MFVISRGDEELIDGDRNTVFLTSWSMERVKRRAMPQGCVTAPVKTMRLYPAIMVLSSKIFMHQLGMSKLAATTVLWVRARVRVLQLPNNPPMAQGLAVHGWQAR